MINFNKELRNWFYFDPECNYLIPAGSGLLKDGQKTAMLQQESFSHLRKKSAHYGQPHNVNIKIQITLQVSIH
jgi:hypothetical protein